jgi:hypothetical protein
VANHDITLLDKATQLIDTSLEGFKVWMVTAGSLKAVERINADLIAAAIQGYQVQHPKLQLRLRMAIQRVKVRHLHK